jgi:hypothetical protein
MLVQPKLFTERFNMRLPALNTIYLKTLRHYELEHTLGRDIDVNR